MRIEQFLYITEIAKTGSIATTAQRLYVSSPSISLAISSLEEELGVKIFERSRTGLEPTETGKKLIIKAQKILNNIEELRQESQVNASQITGSLTISADPAISRSLIPKTFAEVKAKFPGINPEIKDASSSQVRKDVLNGDADIGLICYPSGLREENQLLITTHIIDNPWLLCFRKDSELASKDNLTIEDIQQYPLAANLSDFDRRKFHSMVFRENSNLNFNVLVQSQQTETKKHFISQGLAIGFESSLSIKSDPFYQSEDIIVKPVLGINNNFSYYCIRLKSKFFSAAAKEFLKELKLQAENFKD
ncbi:LysR family transcriptional regulator [Gottfriedia acidiceleris]|uniref:LysR family transcriptional regulator n=1 Tax=Gottfriedia acidiceleris TaxID=371036 RepID=A0ABY4JP24_9BACI|nr:LysR family transcriptional regulator [Gottfriedia acidiceleris]UPM55237.1 LysR family transcriptional regulator [Gottfriedia acidiceleris]